MSLKASLVLFVSIFSFSLQGFASDVRPKYGPAGAPQAIPLSQSHEYFQNPSHSDPQFWALISFYVPQMSHASCSVASLSTVLNAARARFPRTSEDPNLTEEKLLDEVKVEHWKERASKLGYFGKHGVSLEQLGKIAEAAFKQYGFSNATVKVVHVLNDAEESKAAVRKALLSKKPTDYFIANFNQQVFTDDVQAGHFSTVGAFDAEKNRVLILDTDREYFEPYWVSLDTFVKGMATLDGNLHRGYLLISSVQ